MASPLEDPVGFLSSLGGGQTNKVAFEALDWVNKATGKNEPPPGNAQKRETKPNEFMGFLKDGSVLGKLANIVSPGSAPEATDNPVNEQQKMGNVNGFLGMLKNQGGGLADIATKLLPSDIVGGKSSAFNPLLASLIGLGTNAASSGGQGLDVNTLLQIAATAGLKDRAMKMVGGCCGRK